jgi:restriction endonuclease Mrr
LRGINLVKSLLIIIKKTKLLNNKIYVQKIVENGIGVSEVASYRINKIDLDYFTEE